MRFETTGEQSLDYQPCHYGTSRLVFRGPKRATEGGHIAVLGSTETYGKFIPRPWPDLLEAGIGRPVVNLAVMNAGVDVYLGDATVQDICRRASMTVIEMSGVSNLSNRYYSVHPRRNDRFLRASPLFGRLFPEADFTRYHFTRHLLQDLALLDPDRLAGIRTELKAVWLARMHRLIQGFSGRVILLWLGDHPPDAAAAPPDGRRRRGAAGLIDRGMIARLRPLCHGVVEVTADADELERGFTEMVFPPLEAPAAAEMLGPAVHRRVARMVASLINGRLSKES